MAASLYVRPFEPDDVPAIAALFQRVFRPKGRPVRETLERYFRDVYFGHPCLDDESPSLVCGTGGTLRGFFGVLPMPMRIGDRPIRAAVGGNFMVDPELKDPFAGSRLLRAFFEQPRDLAMTDTSNETGRKAWEAHGGITLHACSLQWLRVLRPAAFALAAAARSRPLRPLLSLARPFGWLTDRTLAAVPSGPFRVRRSVFETRPLSMEDMLFGLVTLRRRTAVLPAYTPELLGWLLEMAGRKREFGPLVQRGVFDGTSLIGWYLYHPNAGRWAQVLQLVARPGRHRDVLDNLFADAHRRGSTAVVGRVDPVTIGDLSQSGCVYLNRTTYTQIRTTDVEVREALLAGNALLTRLEGEWWTRFQNDAFDDPPESPVPDAGSSRFVRPRSNSVPSPGVEADRSVRPVTSGA